MLPPAPVRNAHAARQDAQRDPPAILTLGGGAQRGLEQALRFCTVSASDGLCREPASRLDVGRERVGRCRRGPAFPGRTGLDTPGQTR